MASNGSKIVNKPKPKPAAKKQEPKSLAPTNDDERLMKTIEQSVGKTLEGLIPLLNKSGGEPKERTQDALHSHRERVVREINKTFDQRMKANNEFLRKLASAPKEDFRYVMIPRVYGKYFGPTLPVSINGSTINVPVDGRRHKVHKLFVPIIKQKLDYEDEKIAFMEASNFEDVRYVDQGQLEK